MTLPIFNYFPSLYSFWYSELYILISNIRRGRVSCWLRGNVCTRVPVTYNVVVYVHNSDELSRLVQCCCLHSGRFIFPSIPLTVCRVIPLYTGHKGWVKISDANLKLRHTSRLGGPSGRATFFSTRPTGPGSSDTHAVWTTRRDGPSSSRRLVCHGL